MRSSITFNTIRQYILFVTWIHPGWEMCTVCCAVWKIILIIQLLLRTSSKCLPQKNTNKISLNNFKPIIFNFPWTILKKLMTPISLSTAIVDDFVECVVNPKKAMLGESVSTGTQLNLTFFLFVTKSLLSHHITLYFAQKEFYWILYTDEVVSRDSLPYLQCKDTK